ncbi:MAG: AMP-binding protein, partial [Salaquimonas sp.]
MRQTEELPEHLPVLADYLDKWADEEPDRIWLARRANGTDWRRISYGDAREKVRSIASSLLKLGLGPERPLLVLSENSLEHALLGAACFYVGIPYAPVSPAYSLVSQDHGKLKGIAELLKPGAIYADDGDAFAPALASIAAPDQTIITATNQSNGAISFDSLTEGDPRTVQEAKETVTSETVVKYLFTSGSTGSPKAVINTNRMICAMQAMVRDCYRFLEKQPPVVLDWAPWNHTAAGNKVFYLVLTNGGTFYIDDGRPTAAKFDETLRNLRDVSCTWYFNVPVGYEMLVDELEKDPLLAANFFKKLGMMFYAGAGMAQNTWDRLRDIGRKTTGHEVLLATGLGSTETAPFALACTDVQEKSGNVGVPSRGLSMKLVHSGDKLELRLKGPTITPGYHEDAEKTAEAFDEEGYYCMGDALRPADPNDFSKGFYFDGRMAENFKLNTGTWVSVGALRAFLVDAMDGLIRDVVIVGEDKAQVGALFILSEAAKALESVALREALF